MSRALSFLFTLTTIILDAQAQGEDPITGRKNFGLGVGLDHGGFGVRADVHMIESVAIFGGVGYAIAGIGWNVGLIGRPFPEAKVVPYVIGMYGYNTAYILKDQNSSTQVDSDLYFGPSFGGGVEFMIRKRTAFLRVGLLVPIRSDQAEIEHPGITDDLSPILFSAGYHFQI